MSIEQRLCNDQHSSALLYYRDSTHVLCWLTNRVMLNGASTIDHEWIIDGSTVHQRNIKGLPTKDQRCIYNSVMMDQRSITM